MLERANVLGSAIRIAAVVERVDADENIKSADRLGEGKRKRQEDRVAGRNIGDWDVISESTWIAIFRYRKIVGQGRAAERP